MATTDILGLFMSPEQYQAQQMAQQQAGEQQRAFNFAGLDPRQQANYGVFLGAQQLGRGIGGLLGVQDPQLQRIRQRQEIMQSINPADPQSLMAGIQRAAQTNDQELALTLTDFMNKQGSEMALAQQRKAQAARERTQALPAGVQEAELIGKLTEELQKTTDPNQRAVIEAQIQRLQKALRPGAEDKYSQLQDLYSRREEAVAQLGVDSNAVKSLDRLIQSLVPLKGGAGGEGDGEGDGAGKSKNKEIAISRERARLTAKLRSLDSQNMAGSPEYLEAQDELNFLNQAVVAKPSDVEFKLGQARPLIAKRNDLIAQGFSPESKEIRDVEDELEILGAKRGEGKGDKDKVDDVGRLAGYFTELAGIKSQYGTDTEGFENDTRAKALQILIDKASGAKGGGKQPDAIEIADAIAGIKKQIRDAKDPNAPEILQVKDKLAVLEQQLKKDKPNLTVVGEVESGPFAGLALYVDEIKDEQFVYVTDKNGKQVRQPVTAKVDRVTSKVTATATSSSAAAEKEVLKGIAKLDVEDVSIARSNKRAAMAANTALKKLSNLNDTGLISGSFAPSRVGAANFLNTLGLLSQSDANRLATSEQYQKVGSDLVFQSLQGKLGTGISNADRDFIEKIFPRLENSAAARRELIQYIADKNNDLIKEADALETWVRKNKSMEGYKPRISGIFNVTPSGVRSMTDDELEAAIKAAKGKR